MVAQLKKFYIKTVLVVEPALDFILTYLQFTISLTLAKVRIFHRNLVLINYYVIPLLFLLDIKAIKLILLVFLIYIDFLHYKIAM